MPSTERHEVIPLSQLDDDVDDHDQPRSPLFDADISDDDALLGTSDTYRKSAVSSYYRQQSSWVRRLLAFVPRRISSRFKRARKPRPPPPPPTKFRLFLRYVWISICCFIIVSVVNGILRPSYQDPPAHYQRLEQQIETSTKPGRGNPTGEKIFIAANIIDEKLIRGAWGESLSSLVYILGPENVFVSVYENDSGPGTSDALRSLRDLLTCNSSIITGAHLPLSEFPTVHIPEGGDRVQRITYLAEVRNRLLRPLDATHAADTTPGFQSVADVQFDRVLFINDVHFNPVDAAQLLFSTNADSGKANYRTACAIDFTMGVFFYDSFVVRDTDGYQMGFMTYPWFTTKGSSATLSAVREQIDAVPVRTCWGGMAAFDAALFQTKRSTLPQDKELALLPSSFSGSEFSPQVPLSFRGSGEPFWEAAECCLIFADIEVLYGYPDADAGTGIYINPYVRVAYTQRTWDWLDFWHRYERAFEFLQYLVTKIGYPEFNPRREHEPGQLVEQRVWTQHPPEEGDDRFDTTKREAPPGGFCGQRRMFVMKTNLEASNMKGDHKNWEKVKIPSGAR